MSKINPLTFIPESGVAPSLGQMNVWSNSWRAAEKLAVAHFGQMHGSPAARGMYALAKGAAAWGRVGRDMLEQQRYLEKSKSRGDWLGLAVCARAFKLDDVALLAVEAFAKGEADKPSQALSADEIDELAGCVRIVARSLFLEPPLARVLSLDVAAPAIEKSGVSVPDLLAKRARGVRAIEEANTPANSMQSDADGAAKEQDGAGQADSDLDGVEEAKALMARALDLMASRAASQKRTPSDSSKMQAEVENLRREVERLRKELLESRQANLSVLATKHEAQKALAESQSRQEELEKKSALLACENARLRGRLAETEISEPKAELDNRSEAMNALKDAEKVKWEREPYEHEDEVEEDDDQCGDVGEYVKPPLRIMTKKINLSDARAMEMEKIKNDMLNKVRTRLIRRI